MSEAAKASRSPAGRRSLARLAAVQALYQIDLSGTAVGSVVAEFRRHRLGREAEEENLGEADAAFFADIVEGVSQRGDELDRAISSVLTPDWPLQRLEVTLRAILRAGVYELLARSDVPAQVVIAEYLAVAHAFFEGKEPGLVNGVLDRLARTLRPGDFVDDGRGGGPAAQ